MSDEVVVRHDWTGAELRAIHDLPLTELLFRAQSAHRKFHPPDTVQLATLLSIKTGACPEDCAYCPQSSRYDTGVGAQRMLELGDVVQAAGHARASGATRFCMGAAWREAPEGPAFERVLAMVRAVARCGLEPCVTLGMLTQSQAVRLKEAGLRAYNHNLDTSREFYAKIISTRTYDDRLQTLQAVRNAGLEVCCGGIVGMGESVDDRLRMLATLAAFDPHPESVPVNALVRVPGTPLAEQPPIDGLDFVRVIATARIALPRSKVRLSAGRNGFSRETQILCLLAGANSIFFGDQLLTTPNPEEDADLALLAAAGMRPLDGERPPC